MGDVLMDQHAFRKAHAAWTLVLWPGKKVYLWSGSKDHYIGAPRAALYRGNGSLRLTILGVSLSLEWPHG